MNAGCTWVPGQSITGRGNCLAHPWYSVHLTVMDTATWEALGRQVCLKGNGHRPYREARTSVPSRKFVAFQQGEKRPGARRIPIDRAPFYAGPDAVSAVYLWYLSEAATQTCGKWGLPLRMGPQIGPCRVALCSFGVSKLHSARLAWPDWKANAGRPHSVNRP